MSDEPRAGVEQGEPIVFGGAESAHAPGPAGSGSNGAGAVTITIPLTLTLRLGDGSAAPPPQPGAPPPPTAPARPAEPQRTPPAAFAGHAGYVPDFLGTSVPMPAIKASPRFGGPLEVSPDRRSHPDDAHELRYANYSVIMNAARRTAYVAAVNVDYAAPFREGRPRSEDWWLDGRIPDEAQLDNRYYEGNDYDRGHLAMRADCAWGMTREAAMRGNLASFHWTNCALQHKLFNQASGRRLWGDLENHIAAQGRGQRIRLSVFNGPVFAPDDRPMRDAQVPAQFWKIVVWQDAADARPGAVGFVLDQSGLIQDMPIEAIDPGAFSIRQKAIADIDAMLDVDLSGLAAFDRFRVTEGAEAAAGDPASVLIRSLDDMVL
ncbi:MAG: DNA/RNA non-specific endonuclease [Sphingomonadaceae bacterium]